MKSFIITVSAIALMLLGGCAATDIATSEQPNSDVKLFVQTDSRSNLISVSSRTVGADPIYRLTIYNRKNEAVATYEDYTKAGSVRLVAGRYRFVVESGVDVEVGIDTPYYFAEQTVNVQAGVDNNIEMTATLANCRVSVDFSELIKDGKNFKNYSFSVGNVTLTPELITQHKSIYVSAKSGQFTWTLSLVNSQDKPYGATQTVSKVEGRSHYQFFFAVDNSATEEDGNITLNLKVDDSHTVTDENIDINLEKRALPEFKPVGFVVGQQKIIKNVEVRDAKMELGMAVASGVEQIILRHTSPALDAINFPRKVSLTTILPSELDLLKTLGVTWTQPLGGSTAPNISFTKLAEVVPLGDYCFYVTVIDRENQLADGVVSFAVLPDQDHFARSVDNGAKYAIFNGEWCTLNRPEDLTFQYRKASDAEWTTIDAAQMTYDDATKLYTTRVKGLDIMTKYAVRSYTAAAIGNELTFTTHDAPTLPNLSFDEGYWSGSYWYPNADGGNSYWATGNDGIVAGPVSMSANNRHTEDAVKGKAVYMLSVPITYGLSPVKFAAGSIFTGSYKTDMGTPKNSVKFGRPYTGRPLQLKGWYKYKPVNINNDKNGVAGSYWGKLDKCHIYISLEDWGSKNATVRPGSPRIVGYGEFKSDATVTSYTQFTIDIEYKENRTPTHVVMAATASFLGGDFCGGNGSEMYIDEFELVWE